MTAVLETRELVKTYGSQRALDGLDLAVPQGCLFGLVGHNGAGKTTLLGIASGRIRAGSGTIDLLGDGPFQVDKHTGRVSVLPQDAGLPPYARVGELLCYYGRLQGMPASAVEPAARTVLEEVNLADRWKAPVRALSHGMFRRLTVAQALLGDPELVLLDEPMSGLDPHEVSNLREVLRRRAGPQTILISSHILHELEHLCDEVAFMRNGRTERQDRMADVVGHHRTLRIRLQGDEVPDLETLAALVAPATCTYIAEKGEVRVDFDPTQKDSAAMNAVVLPALIQQGCGVVEVHRGGGLEGEYLRDR